MIESQVGLSQLKGWSHNVSLAKPLIISTSAEEVMFPPLSVGLSTGFRVNGFFEKLGGTMGHWPKKKNGAAPDKPTEPGIFQDFLQRSHSHQFPLE